MAEADSARSATILVRHVDERVPVILDARRPPVHDTENDEFSAVTGKARITVHHRRKCR